MKAKKDFDRLVDRMNRAYGCFLLWKYIRKSMSIPETGQKETERRLGIMNRYGGVFTGILYGMENVFITDLHKFFDKSKDNLKLETITKNLPEKGRKEIALLEETIKTESGRLEILRHNFSAHEPKNPKEEKIFAQEIEKIFSVIQQILNIVSESTKGPFMTWDLWENNTNNSFINLINDLELGYKARANNQQNNF